MFFEIFIEKLKMTKNKPKTDLKPEEKLPISTGREHDNVTFKTWIVNLFEDERGQTSIKPVIAFLGAIFLCGIMLANAFDSSFVPADFLVDAVMIIVAIGMGADSIDKFSSKRRSSRHTYTRSSYSNYDNTDIDNDDVGETEIL